MSYNQRGAAQPVAPLLKFEGIRKRFPNGHVALRGVTLNVTTGVMGLLGPNGAGKTTLMSIAVLAVEPSEGVREYFGVRDHPKHSAAIRRRIGYLPQSFTPPSDMTVAEFLTYCGETRTELARTEVRRRVDALLEMVALQAERRMMCWELSGGMKRRLGIAQAVVHSPSIVIVDEPTSGLDVGERIRFQNLLAELASNCAVLLSSHVAEDIEMCAERVAILLEGRIALDSTVASLRSTYAGRLAIRERNRVASGDEVVLGARVAPSGRPGELVLLAETARGEGELRDPSLEEAYTAFVGEKRGAGRS